MPSTLPRSVRESWGEQAADDFAGWLDDRIRERAVHRDDFREVLSRLDVLENEVAGIDDRLDRFETRFDQIDQRFDRLHEQMRVQTRWTVGPIALFGTIVTVLLAIAQFGGG